MADRPANSGNPLEVAQQRLQRAAAAIPAGEQSPEMLALLRSMEGLAAAESQLTATEKALGPVPDMRQPDANEKSYRWAEKACQTPELYQGLLQLAEAGLEGMMLGCYSLSPGLQAVLSRTVLFPIFFTMDGRETAGSFRHGMYAGHQILQQLAASFLWFSTRTPALWQRLDVLAALGKGLEDVWPGITAASPQTECAEARRARRLLAGNHWVPSLPAQTPAEAGDNSDGLPAGADGEPASEVEGMLQEGLRICCPDVGAARVRRLALMYWLELATCLLLEQDARCPPAERILVVAQLALSSGQLAGEHDVARIWHSVVKVTCGLQVSPDLASSPQGAALLAAGEAAAERAGAARLYKEASGIARALCGVVLMRAAGQRGEERAALLAQVDALAERATAWVQATKPWLPKASYKNLEAIDRSAKQQMMGLKAQLQRGESFASLGVAEAAGADVARCAYCKDQALHLRACAACRKRSYCSRSCQVAHWKAGHKAGCRAAQGGGTGA